MEHPTQIDNPYAAPAADVVATSDMPRRPIPWRAFGLWLTGMGVCGAIFAADRLLCLNLADAVFSLVFSVGICLSIVGAVGMRRRWFVTLFLIVAIFIGIILEILVVGAIEMMVKGIGRFGGA
jgi:hypothetical protein